MANTKTARLEKALTGKRLTKTAISNRFGITNVSAFIYDLRRKGLNVTTDFNKSGEVVYSI